ncbi:TIGR01244 family phosphatase [Paracoccus aurantiacus]|uniref:TIGR01244 family phosphatase n=1 Tax=Paracoccus aurantiacus TaxID=2599412 RepID=A0A5C6SB00_9RHOB|nr:TIGR01244 family sulfur transferase [Paracoccus aurantiacus]TXB70963.1 TIGR01244 family phosphatase [Paracoccus aurantiacus]
MDIRKIDESISVAPQLQPEDFADLAQQGYRAVICNRPDGEAADQPSQQEMAEAALAAGLEFRYLPLAPGQLTPQLVDEFGTAIEQMPGPVLAYCRSGTRSATLWALSQSGKRAPSEILKRASEAGYDLGGIAGGLAEPG